MNDIEVLGLSETIEEDLKEEQRVIAFLLNKELIGIDIKNIIKITKRLDITPVPKTPEHILGVMNLRGNIVPVVNVKQMLGLPHDKKEEQEFILIIDSAIGNIGLMIDQVVGAITIDDEEILPAPINSIGIDAKYITGVVVTDEEVGDKNLLILLDIEKLFHKSDQENEE
ncbi:MULTISPECIES: chemotaxis protein CheW [Nitratiruptor]|uniref:Purine-binding chemotaxis protein CheW n=1 Tax=Nitratiruptor tergarcus DSM 16512 TaxID=1069081 RepID=A0A1W1WSU1_9BACT|nr:MULTISPECIES: chemotaxis protein CheW [Nitratiruptor]BCD61842.1 purine-binding chemotaxis protein CheW [Nitratiruptor sp. YY08-13]BCD65777.1 purine-binding chemotaxis protein CheW [Nitratiruptor sp. YY08-26]SMC09269.1 purine-binding chemotaxis protein CheW [Nitratiruptor tergarcus DSM 16512]